MHPQNALFPGATSCPCTPAAPAAHSPSAESRECGAQTPLRSVERERDGCFNGRGKGVGKASASSHLQGAFGCGAGCDMKAVCHHLPLGSKAISAGTAQAGRQAPWVGQATWLPPHKRGPNSANYYLGPGTLSSRGQSLYPPGD